jgi:hypothetical protein
VLEKILQRKWSREVKWISQNYNLVALFMFLDCLDISNLGSVNCFYKIFMSMDEFNVNC